eukprot:6212031-Pleurochrysis_carterae.AAC.7
MDSDNLQNGPSTGVHSNARCLEGYMGYPPGPDWMYLIGSYVLRCAGCHDNGDHVLYGAPRHISECRSWKP